MSGAQKIKFDEAARLTALFALFVLTAVAALLIVSWKTTSDSNRAESSRINQAIDAALQREQQRIVNFAANYNDWDDEFLEDWQSVQGLTETVQLTDPAENFDVMWLLNSRGGEIFTVIPSDVAPNQSYPPHHVTQRLIAQLRSGSAPASTLAKTGDGASIFVLAPLDEQTDLISVAADDSARYILLEERLTGDFLAGVGDAMQLQSVTLHPLGSKMGQVQIRDSSNTAIAELGWSMAIDSSGLSPDRINFVFAIAILLSAFGFIGARQFANSFRAISRQSKIDHLSKLPNRFELLRRVRQKRDAEDFSALALIDLDSFKSINDFHGHRTGDAVIRHVARLLLECSPTSATVARLGGDEFAVFFIRESDLAEEALNQFLRRLSETTIIEGISLRLGASIGLTMLGTSRHASEGLRQADIAMYAAKKRGKMQIATFDDSMETPLRELLTLKEELHQAIEKRQIFVKYQPIISAKTGKIETLEALARWSSSVRGNVAADKFIMVAEEFGLIGRLGNLILENVINDMQHLPNVRIALNVSTAQIATFEFATMLEQHIQSGRINGENFDIEITETHLVHDPQIILHVMKRLSNLGVRFVLDDFGTGFASIGFLRQFPFNAVKIDRSIINECLLSSQARTMLSSIVAMAHACEMIVVAEGIETERHEALARAAGCDLLQGWLFGRAVNADDRSLHIATLAEAHAA